MQQITEFSLVKNFSGLFPSAGEPLFTPNLQLENFVSTLFEAKELVEIRAIESWHEHGNKRSRFLQRLWLESEMLPKAYPKLYDLNTSGANIYFGVNPRIKRSGKKDGIQTTKCIWMDFDGVTPDEARSSWHPYIPEEPSIVVSSGHGVHAYWLLDAPHAIQSDADRALFESMLKALYQAIGCDAVQDVSRVLRLPGFWNVKSLRTGALPTPCKLVTCEPKKAYPFSIFSSWWKLAQKEVSEKTDQAGPLPDRAKYPLSPEAEHLIYGLDLEVQDRSRRDYAIILKLLRIGLSSDEIWQHVSDKSKFKERGRKYFNLTLHNAMRELGRT